MIGITGESSTGDTAPTGSVRRFGRYEVLRPLGRGAMGVVYLARDPQLERTVALKTVWWPDQREDDSRFRTELRARFLREARAAAQFVHSNIITVFDVGEDGDVTFIAMEYVAGRTLAELLAEEGPLPPVRAAQIAAAVADALGYAHAKGIVHRDIKPANLLVTPEGVVKVADFGIARVANSTLTQEATVLGTPAYMAPEQIAGRPVDGRADLFSLGVVLFEMVTGRRPFEGSDLTALVYQIAHAPHPPLASLRPGLPRGLEQICARALAKDPAARYQTAAEMAGDLRAVAAGKTPAGAAEGTLIHATPMGTAEPSPRAPQAGSPSLTSEERAAVLAAEAARAATRLGQHGGRLLERLLATLAAGLAAAAGFLWAMAGQAWAAFQALPPTRRYFGLGVIAVLVALWVLLAVVLDPVRPARRLLAEEKRDEAVALLLKLEADDPDQVEARILLLEHAESCAVRKRVARRLGEIGDPAALPALEAARRRGVLDNLCMGGTLDQAIARLRGESPAARVTPAGARPEDGSGRNAQSSDRSAGQDPAADVKRVFKKIGDAFR